MRQAVSTSFPSSTVLHLFRANPHQCFPVPGQVKTADEASCTELSPRGRRPHFFHFRSIFFKPMRRVGPMSAGDELVNSTSGGRSADIIRFTERAHPMTSNIVTATASLMCCLHCRLNSHYHYSSSYHSNCQNDNSPKTPSRYIFLYFLDIKIRAELRMMSEYFSDWTH